MIITTILYLIYYFVWVITQPFRWLPDVSLSANFAGAVVTANGYLAALTQILPIATVLAIFFIVLTIEGLIFAYKSTMWVIRRIPGQG